MTSAGTSARARPSPTRGATPFFSRREHIRRLGSTNDLVAAWLAEGTPEVCFATAEEQTHGRGREGRTWQAPLGTSLLLSLGFRPGWLAPERTWQLAAVVPLAMADAAEEVAGLARGVIRLKWPNDLVVQVDPPASTSDGPREPPHPAIRKLGGVLGETSGLGTDDPRAVIGIGVNADWERDDFPAELAEGMTSLRDESGGRPVDRVPLLDAFLDRLQAAVEGLRNGRFALSDWQQRQVTTGRLVDLLYPAGHRVTVVATGVDPSSGGLIVEEANAQRVIHSAEILHVRLAGV